MNRFIGVLVMLTGLALLALSWSGAPPGWKARQSAAMTGVSEIRLDIEGDIDVNIVAEDRADLTVSLEGSGSLQLSRQLSGLLVEASRSSWSWFPFDATVVVRVPESYSRNLTVIGEHGGVQVSGGAKPLQLDRLEVKVDTGSLRMERAAVKELHYTTDKGTFHAEDTDIGSSVVKLDSGKIALRRVKGSLQASVDTGDIDMQSAALVRADMNIDNGGITLADYSGDWTAKIGTGSMDVERLSGGKGTLHIDKGDFNISHYIGDWDAQLGKGSMRVVDSAGNWNVVMTKGDFNAQRLTGGQGTLNIGKGNLNASAYSGGLTAAVADGDVILGLTDVAKPVAVRVTSGTINVGLPPYGDYTLQADTPHGSSVSVASLAGTAVQDERHVQAVIGQGTVPITLQSDKGDVIVHDGEGRPAAKR